jgi:sorbitol/mannitol transport system permease protein
MARAGNGKDGLTITIVAWAVGLLVAFPILWMLLTSFKSEVEAFRTPPRVLGFAPTLDNYAAVLADGAYYNAAVNSLLTAGGSTLIGILIGVPAAWAMAFMPTRRTRGILMWMLGTKMLPPAAVLIPIYFIFRDTHLLDTRTAVSIMLCTGSLPIIIWMLFTYFREIPGEILEAARIDGATVFQELTQVLIPIALPGIASTFLLNFLLAWNESFWTLNITSIDAAPLTAFIASFSAPHGLFWARLSAASVLAIAPVLVIGWFCQRQLVRGLTFGAVK